MCVKGKHLDGKECGEIHLALSRVNYLPSALNPLCSLWLFSKFSVLNSEKLNTEATDTDRAVEPQSLVDKKRVEDNRHGGVMQKARTSERGLIV
jgi:hypothetical protein